MCIELSPGSHALLDGGEPERGHGGSSLASAVMDLMVQREGKTLIQRNEPCIYHFGGIGPNRLLSSNSGIKSGANIRQKEHTFHRMKDRK